MEREYNWEINRYIKYHNKKNNTYLFFDGIATFPKKDILFEIKYVRNKEFMELIYINILQQLLNYSYAINTDKNIELTKVLILDNIQNKEILQISFNKKLQKDLSNTRYSGQVLIINKNDL